MKKRMISFTLAVIICFCTFFTGQIVSAAKMRGDVYPDGIINAKDSLMLKKHLAGLANVDETQADCNGDGDVSIDDANALCKYLVSVGELHIDYDEGWNMVYDWESETVGQKPKYVSARYASIGVKSLKYYSVKNDKNSFSQNALAIVPDGLATNSYTSGGSNPTTGHDPSRIDVSGKLEFATNLRMLLNVKNNIKKDSYVIYIGCYLDGKKYYCSITVENYGEFNYFYFADKEFTVFETKKRRTYFDEPETRVITKDDIKNIRYIYVWMESNASTELIVDDIEYFEGVDGYDSSAEDAALPQPEEPVNDGKEKYICVSFDDGPQYYNDSTDSSKSNYYMEYYIELAKKYDAKFSFFLNGANWDGKLTEDRIPVLKKAIDEGHELQNHTWSHTNLTSIQGNNFTEQKQKIAKQVNDIDEWLEKNIGVKTTLLRPPFLGMNTTTYAAVKEYTNIKANIAGYCPNDYDGTSVDYRMLYYKKNLKDCAIILAHEPYIDNVETMERVMQYFGNLGYKFVTISELFEIKGITPVQNKMYNVVE